MTRRPHLSITPTGLAYVSGDYHDRDSAPHAENALRVLWGEPRHARTHRHHPG